MLLQNNFKSRLDQDQFSSHSLPDRHELLKAPNFRPRIPSAELDADMPGLSLPAQTPPTESSVDIGQNSRSKIRSTRSLSFFSDSGSQFAGMGKTSSYRGPSAISTLSTSPTIMDTLKMTAHHSFHLSGLSLAINQIPGVSKPSGLSMAFSAQSPTPKLALGSPSPILGTKDLTTVDDSCTN